MKQLTLVRHAKSSWKDPDLDDRERPLNRRGKEEASEMGRRLAARGVRPDALITSPARRARSTARRIAREIAFPADAIREDEEIYEAGLPALLELVRSLDEGWNHVMLVGHNPGFSDLASFLCGGLEGDLPTCAVVSATLDARTWRDVEEKLGTVVLFDYPKRG